MKGAPCTSSPSPHGSARVCDRPADRRELTDSVGVAVHMRIMTRMGQKVLDAWRRRFRSASTRFPCAARIFGSEADSLRPATIPGIIVRLPETGDLVPWLATAATSAARQEVLRAAHRPGDGKTGWSRSTCLNSAGRTAGREDLWRGCLPAWSRKTNFLHA